MSTQQLTATAQTWQIDPAHTLVEFSVRHMMIATVKGRFGTVAGTIRLDDEDPARSAVDVTIDAASVDTRNEQRDAHLRSADFFDVANHPTLTFRSRRVERTREDHYRVTGDLTIRGTTRSVVLDVIEQGRITDPWGATRAAFSARATVNREDFGLTWNQALEAGGVLVSRDVVIDLEVQASLPQD
jgi:polyisoprenoid-binding protein YceI